MSRAQPEGRVSLPEWMADVAGPDTTCASIEERMAFVVDLARRNVAHGTGGPFGAAVFERDTGRLVAPGVNRVVPLHNAAAHAEIVAITLAGVVRRSFDLGAPDAPPTELVTSVEPCAMCYGAVPWSGVSRLVCGARADDARAVGFDEGDKPADWVAALERRGIVVVTDVSRPDAAVVLREYAASGGPIYNGSAGA